MKVIDGQAIAGVIAAATTEQVVALRSIRTVPALAVVVPTDNEATAWYVRSIARAAKKAGIVCRSDLMPGATREEIENRLAELSLDPSVHGIICQTPIPRDVGLNEVAQYIAPAKDVDGANPTSLGLLAAGLPTFAPATAAAVLEILHREEVPLIGTRVAVVGRSTVVGKPVTLLLLAEHATVTVCHSRTKDLAEICAQADVLVAAVGRAGLIGATHVKSGAVIVDVGTNATPDGHLVGDVDQEAVQNRAGSLTPVPGGVGPVTVALLLRHVAAAAGRLAGVTSA